MKATALSGPDAVQLLRRAMADAIHSASLALRDAARLEAAAANRAAYRSAYDAAAAMLGQLLEDEALRHAIVSGLAAVAAVRAREAAG
jgi:hypothetical protein